ncbi:MAG: thiamine phosphate synthase [Longimicrobiaceae bacterium]
MTLPRLHLVTDSETLRAADFPRRMRAVLEAGKERVALHLRGPGMEGRELYQLAMVAARRARATGSLLLVNDRFDVALAAGADGVQLGGHGVPADAVRGFTGKKLLIGRSVHSRGEASRAGAEGADFLLFGTVYATPSHPGRPGRGVATVRGISNSRLPVIAIGGITPGRAARVTRAGAYGVAVLRGVWRRADPEVAVAVYLDEIETAASR